VAAILMIFLRTNLPNFVQFKQYQDKPGPRRTMFKTSFQSLYCCEYKRKLSDENK